MLYWFRTPPGVRVGRLALDPEAIQSIEDANPELRFDWDKILKVKPPPPPQEYDREGREERRARRRRREASAADQAPPAEDTPPAAPPPTDEIPEQDIEAVAQAEGEAEGRDEAPTHVVLGLTDREGLARLRARYAAIVARINDRPREPEQLAALQEKAALIDPDAWGTVEEARQRLTTLDETTEALRAALGRRRRSRRGGARRRRRRGSETGETAGADQAAPATPDTPDNDAAAPAATPPTEPDTE